MIRKSFRLAQPKDEFRIDVPAAIPTHFLLMAHAAAVYGTDDWQRYWVHKDDPICRVGYNWPKDESAKDFLLNQLGRKTRVLLILALKSERRHQESPAFSGKNRRVPFS